MEKPIWYLLESIYEEIGAIGIDAEEKFGYDAIYELNEKLIIAQNAIREAANLAEKLK